MQPTSLNSYHRYRLTTRRTHFPYLNACTHTPQDLNSRKSSWVYPHVLQQNIRVLANCGSHHKKGCRRNICRNFNLSTTQLSSAPYANLSAFLLHRIAETG